MVSLAVLRKAKRKYKEVKGKMGEKSIGVSEKLSQIGNIDMGWGGGEGAYGFEMPPVRKRKPYREDTRSKMERIKAASKTIGTKAIGISERLSEESRIDVETPQGEMFGYGIPKKGRKKKTRRKQPEKEFDMFDIL